MAACTTSVLSHFVRVTEDFPCPICGHDTWCLVAKDGKKVICPRVVSQRNRGELGYLHHYDGAPIPKRLVEEPPKQIDPGTIERLARIWFQRADLSYRAALAHELGVSVCSLIALRVGWNGKAFTFPMHDVVKTVGIRCRGENGKKWSLKGGSAGLFIPERQIVGDTLFVTEGPTDLAALLDWGVSAIGRPNATACRDLVREYVALWRPRLTVIVADNDKDGDGLRGASKLHDEMTTPSRVIKPARTKDARGVYNQGVDRRYLIDAAHGSGNREWEVVT